MSKWEYCKIVVPALDTMDSELRFLGAAEGEGAKETIKSVSCTIAQLGCNGWEMVSHTQVWDPGKGGAGREIPIPICEVYYFKRTVVTNS